MSTAHMLGLLGLFNLLVLTTARFSHTPEFTVRGTLCGYGMSMLVIASWWTCSTQEHAFSIAVPWALAALNLSAAFLYYLHERWMEHRS